MFNSVVLNPCEVSSVPIQLAEKLDPPPSLYRIVFPLPTSPSTEVLPLKNHSITLISSKVLSLSPEEIERAKEELTKLLNKWEKYYRHRMRPLDGLVGLTNLTQQTSEEIYDKSQYQDFLEPLLSTKYYDILLFLTTTLNSYSDKIKFIKTIVDFFVNFIKLNINFHAKNKLEGIEKEYHLFCQHSEMVECLSRISKLQKQLIEQEKETRNSIACSNFKFFQQFIYHFLPETLAIMGITRELTRKCVKGVFDTLRELFALQKIEKSLCILKQRAISLQPPLIASTNPDIKAKQEQQNQEIAQFMQLLENSQTVADLDKALKQANIDIETLGLLSDWEVLIKDKKFTKKLIHQYEYKRGFINFKDEKKLILSLSDKRKKLFEDKETGLIQRTEKNYVNPFLEACDNKKFEEIQEEMKELHLSFSLEEWDKSHDDSFKQCLAIQLINQEEGKAFVSKKTLEALLLKKIAMESQVLKIEKIQQAFELGIATAQLPFRIPYLASIVISPINRLPFAKFLLDQLNTELSDIIKWIDVRFLYLIYSDLGSTISEVLKQLGMASISFVFLHHLKPHSYSGESYKIKIQIQWIQTITNMYHYIFLMRKIALAIRIYLINTLQTCIPHQFFLQLKEREETLWTMLNQEYKEYNNSQKLEIDKLNHQLIRLNVKDFNLMMKPFTQKEAKTKAQVHLSNPLTDLAELLDKARFDLWPKKVIDFWKNIGIELTQANSKQTFLAQLENVFGQEAKELILN